MFDIRVACQWYSKETYLRKCSISLCLVNGQKESVGGSQSLKSSMLVVFPRPVLKRTNSRDWSLHVIDSVWDLNGWRMGGANTLRSFILVWMLR